MKKLLPLLFILFSVNSYSQIFKGDEETNDTLFFVQLDTFSISARTFDNFNYSRYEMIVAKVYPIADTAVFLLNQVNETTPIMSRKEEKKYKKQKEDELRDKFESRLKNMSRSQGEVLIDIIERNSGRTMYDILKDVKSSGTAFWWTNLSKAYGYDLKSGYNPENNPTLEKIILEYEARKNKMKK